MGSGCGGGWCWILDGGWSCGSVVISVWFCMLDELERGAWSMGKSMLDTVVMRVGIVA